jgi:peptidoglycan hydrolase-like protein with peptidoglycan-binding domain
MKHAMSAVVALAFGLGLATAAQAHGSYKPNAATPTPGMNMQQGAATNWQMQQGAATGEFQNFRAGHLTRAGIKQVQQQLRSEGLYNGRIDGRVGPEMRRAVAKFQRQNGLRQTARLDRNTLQRLMSGQNVGVGSSQPNNINNRQGNFNTQPNNLNQRNELKSSGAGSGSSLPNNINNGTGGNFQNNNENRPSAVPPGTNAGGNNMQANPNAKQE